MKLWKLLAVCCPLVAFAQIEDGKHQEWNIPTGMVNTQSNHPFGLWMSRIQHQFGSLDLVRTGVQWSTHSGNVWLPSVSGHVPISPEDAQSFSALEWHERAGHFDPSQTETQRMRLHVDGVFKRQSTSLSLPIGTNTLAQFKINSFFFENGQSLFNTINRDDFIEWFHTNVARDEDPFARKKYGFDQAAFEYQDKTGRVMKLEPNRRYFSGFETRFLRQIPLKNQSWKLLSGMHLGFNMNDFFPGIDLGLQGSMSKEFSINPNQKIQIGQSIGLLAPRFVQINEAVQLSTRKLIYSQESSLKWIKRTRKGNFFVFSTTYFIQSSYFKSSEMDALILSGKRYTSHWHYSLSHLFRKLTANNFIFEYHFSGQSIGWYLREDLLVDNAPDIQMGAVYRISL